MKSEAGAFGKWLVIGLVVCAAWSAVSYGAEMQPLTLDVPRCETPPKIDGDLSDKCWQAIAPIKGFFIYKGGGKTTDSSVMRVTCDDEWLYLALQIELPNMKSFELVELEHDGPIHSYDSVEVFVDPGADGETYLHYLLGISNARGERRCVRIGDGKPDVDIMWNVPWRSATKITGTGWQAEIALPLSVVAESGGFKKMAMNVGVNRIITTLNEFGVVVAANREVSSWAPVERGFHEPEKFGLLKGLENLKPRVPLLAAARAVGTGGYQVDADGGFFYEVAGGIQRYTDTQGTVRVMVEDKPGAGTGEKVYTDVELVSESVPFSLKVPVKALSDRTANLALMDVKTGEVLQLLFLRDMAGLSLMRSFVRRSWYTSEENAEIVCELGLPGQELAKMKLVVKDSAGKMLAAENKPKPQTFVKVPIKELKIADGKHTWTVELQRADGKVAVGQAVEMVKRAPRPGAEWKTDHAQGCILNNGEPFFPFGIMAKLPLDNADGFEVMCKDMADMGFNTVVRWGSVDVLTNVNLLYDMAEKYRFYVVERPHTWKGQPKGPPPAGLPEDGWWDWALPNIWQPVIKKLMHQPRLVAWYIWDEPWKTPQMAEQLIKVYKSVNEADGYHPVEVLYIPPFPPEPVFSESCDILGVDPYWVPGGGVGSSPNSVGRVTLQTRRRADRDLKLAWITPCAELFSGTRMRIFNEKEQRVQTYLSLIHGAQALLYFVYPFQHQSTFETFKRLGDEMKILGPACAAGRVPHKVTYTPVEFDPDNSIYTDVQVSLKRNPKGGYILLAANWRAYPVEVHYKISLLGGPGKVGHLFDKKTSWPVKGSSFNDTLGAMDTRAYAIPGPAELAAPVEIAVDLNAQPDKTDRFYTRTALPDGGVAGRRNLLYNSGFEECSIPGIPDYYRGFRSPATLQKGYRIGDSRGDSGILVDAQNPYEGKYSVRLSNASFLFSAHKFVEKDTPYVLSFYARSDKKDARILVNTQTGYKERVRCPVGTEWQRCEFKFNLPTMVGKPSWMVGGGHVFYISVPEGMTVWIDAMQLEEGTKPTEYEAQ